MRIRLAWLFLRSRLAARDTRGLRIVTLLFAIWCFNDARIGEIPIVVTVAVPVLMAPPVAGTTNRPFGDTEQTGSQTRVQVRLGQFAGMPMVATAALFRERGHVWVMAGEST